MASLTGSQTGNSILLPLRRWLEPDWLYQKRCDLFMAGRQDEAEQIKLILDAALNELHENGLIEPNDLPK